jgi:NAD(P)-dependent dehydrogenase (short-subunit alcohol dehydrogenase family)
MRGLQGKVCVVAGAGKRVGIGAAVCARLAEEGARVVVSDIDGAAAEETVGRLVAAGAEAMAVTADVSDEAQVDELVARTCRRFGGLDAFHFNAAALHLTDRDTDPLGIDMDLYDETMQVNLRGAMLCTRAALPAILERGGGSIVYTGSGAAYNGAPVRVAYAMSKTALSALARNVAAAYGKRGVRANVVSPGLVVMPKMTEATIESARQRTHAPRLGKPEDIANMVTMLFSADGEWVTGQTISVNGGIYMRP